MTRPQVSAHTAGVVAALVAAGLHTDVARKPDSVPNITGTKTPAVGYCVVYPLPGGSRDGPVSNPDDDAVLPYQITCVAADPMAVQDVADTVDTAMHTVLVAGRTVTRIEPTVTGGLTRDDTVQPPLFYATPRYDVHTTPA